MRKSKLTLFIVLIIAVCLCFALASCKDEGDKNNNSVTSNSNVQIKGWDIPSNAELTFYNISANSDDGQKVLSNIKDELYDKSKQVFMCDINVKQGDKNIQPNDKISLTMKKPQGFNDDDIVVMQILSTGDVVALDVVSNDNSMTFKTSELSTFVVVHKLTKLQKYEFRTSIENSIQGKILLDNEVVDNGNGYYTTIYAGDSIEFKAVANPGYIFVGWYDKVTDELISDNAVHSFVVNKKMRVKAVFDIDMAMIQDFFVVDALNNFACDIDGVISSETIVDQNATNYPDPSTVEFYIKDKNGQIVRLDSSKITIDLDGYDNCKTPGTYVINFKYEANQSISKSVVVVVNEVKYDFHLTCDSAGGTVMWNNNVISSNGYYYTQTRRNDKITLTATPNENYKFVGWYDNNAHLILSTQLDNTFVVNGNLSVYAKFESLIPEGESEESQAAIDAFTEALEGAFAFEGEKVGFDYNIKVRVADVKEGESMVAKYANIALKGIIDPKTANNNKLQISTNEVVGYKAPVDVFTLFVDENDVYLINAKDNTKAGKRVFPGLGLGAIVRDKVIDPSAVQGLIDTFAGVGGMFFTNGVQKGNAISVDLDLAALADFAGTALGSIVAGDVPEIENTVNGVFADLKNLAEKCTPTFTVVMKDSKIAEFKIVIDVIGDDGKEYNKVDVAIASKVGADVAPTFIYPYKSDFIETNLLNFTLSGDFKMDKTYKFQIRADIDVFTIIKNLCIYGTQDKAKLADIFAGSTTKLYADVKDGDNVLAAAAVDFAVDGKLHVALNTTVPLFGKFLAPTFGKGDFFVYEAVVKDLLKAEIDKNTPPAPASTATAEAVPAPAPAPVDSALVAKVVAKFVSFLTDIDYNVDTRELNLSGTQLVKALDALNAITNVSVPSVGGTEVLNLSDIVDLIPISDEIRISHDLTSMFFDEYNHSYSFKPINLFNNIFVA